jgi:hypothetical protein
MHFHSQDAEWHGNLKKVGVKSKQLHIGIAMQLLDCELASLFA